MPYVRSRMTLIDKEIQMAIARADRLSCEDHFEETYTVGGKPVPVNENGQSIYKYLEEEDCWYSNIHRDDVLVYSRFRLFRRELLQVHYLPLHHQFKSMVGTQGLDLVGEVEEEMGRQRQAGKERVLALARQLVEMSENELEQLSPGNLVEKENISSFLYSVFGVDEKEVAVDLPLHPSLYC